MAPVIERQGQSGALGWQRRFADREPVTKRERVREPVPRASAPA